jgi:hypothetical protein
MKESIKEQFSERIIHQNRFVRKAAPDGAVMPIRNSLKQTTELWKDFNKITAY